MELSKNTISETHVTSEYVFPGTVFLVFVLIRTSRFNKPLGSEVIKINLTRDCFCKIKVFRLLDKYNVYLNNYT